jgi:methylisocitrate lyase
MIPWQRGAKKMSWLLSEGEGNQPARLRALLQARQTLLVPGAHNALAGRLAKQAGFEALYLSGAALSASYALPDVGLLTLDELVRAARAIVRATGLPLIADGDTGYGETLNVVRLVRELEEVGAAAVQLEDQEMPKRCGHLEGKRLVSQDVMLVRLRAALYARRELLIIARTDALAVSGLEDAIARAQAYVAAGADIIFPEGVRTEAEYAAFRRALNVPLLANMTEFGKTPYLTAAQFQSLGYNLVIYPVSSLRLAARAIADGYATLREAGTLEGLLPRMLTRQELYEVIEYSGHEALEQRLQQPGGAEDQDEELQT